MPLVLLLLLIGLPILELFVLIEVGGRIGALYTVGLVILTAVGGLALVRMQGFSTLTRAQARIEQDQMPVEEAVDGIFLVIAGGMLLFPGFVTDAIGLLLLIPPLRRLIGMAVWSYLARRGVVYTDGGVGGGPQGPGPGDVIDGEFEDVTGRPGEGRKPDAPTLPPADKKGGPGTRKT